MPIVLHASGVSRLAALRAGFNLCAIVLLSIAPIIEAMQDGAVFLLAAPAAHRHLLAGV